MVRTFAAETPGRPARPILIDGGFMRKQLLASLLMGLGLCAGPVHAQPGGVRVSIPFRFSVGGKTFAAGDYTMVAGSHQVSVVSQADGKTVALALANDVSGQAAGANGHIVFHCYAERCFLAEVWSPSQENGRRLLISPAEAESGRERRGTYFAILGMKPQK